MTTAASGSRLAARSAAWGRVARAARREREMPRTTVRFVVGQRVRERAMRRAALLGGGGAVDGGARERMSEFHAAALEPHEACVLGRREIVKATGPRALER